MPYTDHERETDRLKLKQCEAQGALKGYVTAMLLYHERGMLTERNWSELRRYHNEWEAAEKAFSDHLFGNIEPPCDCYGCVTMRKPCVKETF